MVDKTLEIEQLDQFQHKIFFLAFNSTSAFTY